MEVVVVDYRSIYVIKVDNEASCSDILAAYMHISGQKYESAPNKQYIFRASTHSPTLYSIQREIKGDLDNDTKIFHFSVVQHILDIANWWAQAYPILESIAVATGALTGVATVVSAPVIFIRWVRNRISKNEYMLLKVLEKDSWNVSLLSEMLAINEDETKKLLRGFGYTWDSRKMLFIATEHTEKLRDIKPKYIRG